jgi:hypothetical protein
MTQGYCLLLIAVGFAVIAVGLIAPRGAVSAVEIIVGLALIAVAATMVARPKSKKDRLETLPWIKSALPLRPKP